MKKRFTEAGESAAANDILFWFCEGKRFFAGSVGDEPVCRSGDARSSVSVVARVGPSEQFRALERVETTRIRPLCQTVPKPLLLTGLRLSLERKQIPQVVENTEN